MFSLSITSSGKGVVLATRDALNGVRDQLLNQDRVSGAHDVRPEAELAKRAGSPTEDLKKKRSKTS
jgi:hypothetical protein